MTMFSLKDREMFLEEDLSDALKGLFVGAVVWQAADGSDFRIGLGFFTNIVQAPRPIRILLRAEPALGSLESFGTGF
jgi:hypothetical protein